MNVERILGDKGRTVVTITADLTLAEAARLLNEKRIGAVVVTDGSGGLAGILSERDIVKAVGQDGPDALSRPVADRMTADVVTCTMSAGVDELMATMTTGKFRHVPVLAGGKLAGIVSIGDLVKQRLADMEAEHQAMKDYITAG